MIAVVQRVLKSAVEANGRKVGEISGGLLVLLGVARGDSETDVSYLVDKIVNLRIFEDDAGKMNRSLMETGQEMLFECLKAIDARGHNHVENNEIGS